MGGIKKKTNDWKGGKTKIQKRAAWSFPKRGAGEQKESLSKTKNRTGVPAN